MLGFRRASFRVGAALFRPHFTRHIEHYSQNNTFRLQSSAATMNTNEGNASASVSAEPKNVVVMIVGATASGKSKLAMELCKSLRGEAEIIVADCVQVYKHVTIGANKPSLEEMAASPHHLVDCFELGESVTSGDFARMSSQCVRDILSRGRTPVIVGGSTMWNNWLVHGIPDAPKSSPEYRQKTVDMLSVYQSKGDWDNAVLLLEQMQTDKPFDLARNNWLRLSRYLEIALMMADQKSKYSDSDGNAVKLSGTRAPVLSDVDVRVFFLSEHKFSLYRRIDTRCLQMTKMGLFQEISSLISSGRLTKDSTVARAIGYRQTIEYLCREKYKPGDVDAFKQFIM